MHAARPSANSEPQGTWHAASYARSAPHYSLRSQGTPVLLGLGVYLPPQEGRRARRVWLLPLESLRVGMLVSSVVIRLHPRPDLCRPRFGFWI